MPLPAFVAPLLTGLPFVASAVGGLLGYKGQRDTNQGNLQIAREDREFQERMSSTAHQRAVADMRQAGLNPILAAGRPASTPGGRSATMQNALAAGINSARAIARDTAEIKNIRETNKLIKAQRRTQFHLANQYLAQGAKAANESANAAITGRILLATATEKEMEQRIWENPDSIGLKIGQIIGGAGVAGIVGAGLASAKSLGKWVGGVKQLPPKWEQMLRPLYQTGKTGVPTGTALVPR